MRRNEFLISSHHPLRETLLMQTGKIEQERVKFLRYWHAEATGRLVQVWDSSEVTDAAF